MFTVMAATIFTATRAAEASPKADREAPAPRASLSDHLRRVRLAAADLLYPPLCTWCRAEVMDPHALCPACWRETHYIAHPLCDRCGAPLSGSERLYAEASAPDKKLAVVMDAILFAALLGTG